MEEKVLGLDIGETSVGWALLRFNEGNPSEIIDAGVRIFKPGATIDERSGDTTSNNQNRRQKRSARRVIQRRAERKRRLKSILNEHGFWPQDGGRPEEVFAKDPYGLRARALDERLEPDDVGRTLYHLCQHRGFKSNRKGDEKEDGIIKTAISNLQVRIDEAGARTLGEYLYMTFGDASMRARTGTAIKNRGADHERHPSRAMLENEFNQIWMSQARFHETLQDPEFMATAYGAIFDQRSYLVTEDRLEGLSKRANVWRAPQLARCPFFTDEPRGRSGTWIAQRFRILKEINNLKYSENYFVDAHQLTPDQRNLILERLSVQKSMTFSAMKKLLKLGPDVRFNLEEGEREALKGNEIEFEIIKVLKSRWASIPAGDKDIIRTQLLEADSADQITDTLRGYGLEDDEINGLLAIRVPDGYMRYSERAMAILVGLMESGLMEYDAIKKAQEEGKLPKTRDSEVLDYLPGPPQFPNPIVMKALYETRKVVNAVIRTFGKPDRIVIELAREAAMTARNRKDHIQKIRDLEKQNKKATDFFVEAGIANPSRTDLIKFRLWKEQRGICPYTGRPIPETALASRDRIVDIDHILPYSRSLDDSIQNKVLCYSSSNAAKGNMTPWEWMGGRTEEFEEMLTRLETNDVPLHKIKRFMQQEIDLEEAISRRLVDTQYASREAAAYMLCLYPPDKRQGQKAVLTNKGGITADLRRWWGLNTILGDTGEKNRNDHRHHAVDAIVIACSSRKVVKQMADTAGMDREDRPQLPPPWPTFRDEVDKVVVKRKRTWHVGDETFITNGIVVSHRVDRKLSGPFHDETAYGFDRSYLRAVEASGGVTRSGQPLPGGDFKKRIPVESLKPKNIEDVVDPAVRACIKKHCTDRGFVDFENAKEFPRGILADLKMPSGVPIRRVRVFFPINQDPVAILDHSGRICRVMKTNNNHHFEFLMAPDKHGQPKFSGRIVSMMEAARRLRIDRVPVISRDAISSVASSESFLFHLDEQRTALAVCQKIAAPFDLVFRDICDARKAKDAKGDSIARISSTGAWQRLKAVKIGVDPIGRITASND